MMAGIYEDQKNRLELTSFSLSSYPSSTTPPPQPCARIEVGCNAFICSLATKTFLKSFSMRLTERRECSSF